MVPPLDSSDPFYIVNLKCTPLFLIPAFGVLGNQTSLVSGEMIAQALGKGQLRWAKFALQRMFSLGKRVTCATLHVGSDNTSMIAKAMGPYMNRKLCLSKNQAGLDKRFFPHIISNPLVIPAELKWLPGSHPVWVGGS